MLHFNYILQLSKLPDCLVILEVYFKHPSIEWKCWVIQQLAMIVYSSAKLLTIMEILPLGESSSGCTIVIILERKWMCELVVVMKAGGVSYFRVKWTI